MKILKFLTLNICTAFFCAGILLFSGPAEAATAKKHAASHASTPVQDFSVIRKAISAAKAKKWQEAKAYAGQLGLPILSKIVAWMEFTEPSIQVPFDDIAKFIKENPEWPLQDMLWQNSENAMEPDVAPEKTVAWFSTKPPVTRKGMIALAEAKKALHPNSPEVQEEANNLIRKAWVKGNFTEKEEKEFLQAYGGLIREVDYARRIDEMLWEGKIDSAKRIMDRVGSAYRQLFDARIALIRNRRDAIFDAKEVPRSLQENEGLLYDAANWYYANKESEKVRHILEYLPKDLDYPDKWANIRMDQIRSCLSEGKYDQAYHLASKHELEEGSDSSEVEWIAGWIALRFLNDPNKAYKHFYALYNNVKTPMSLARAAYWAGRSAESAGKNDIAISWYDVGAIYPTTFYGQLSSLKTGKQYISFPYPTVPTAQDKKVFDSREVILAFRILASINEDEIAKKFLIAAIKSARSAGEMRLISKIGMNSGRREFSVIAAKQAASRGVIFEEESYPTIVNAKAEKGPQDAIEPALAHAIIRQESMFSKTAESPVGALGLMQLMPDTARLMAKKLSMHFSKDRLLSDPGYNMTLGSYYLGHLVNNYDGSYIMAIAAYNGGQGNVSKWVQMYGDPRKMHNIDNVIDWLEVIPFKETRNYVQRVMEAVEVYRYILNKRSGKAQKGQQTALSLDKDLSP